MKNMIKDFAQYVFKTSDADADVTKLIVQSLSRPLRLALEDGGEWDQHISKDQVRAAALWFKDAISRNAHWLYDLDSKGIPYYLYNISDISDFNEMISNPIETHQYDANYRFAGPHERHFMALSGGMHLVSLDTYSSSVRYDEGGRLGINLDDFPRGKDGTLYYSLRNNKGKHLVNIKIEVGCKEITGVAKYPFRPLTKKQLKAMEPLFSRLEYAAPQSVKSIDQLIDVSGRYYDDIREDDSVTIAGRIQFSDSEVVILPSNILFREPLEFANCGNVTLSKGSRLFNALTLFNTENLYVEPGVTINQDIIVHNTGIHIKSADVKIGASIIFLGNKIRSYELPDNLTIEGNLSIHSTSIEKLPNGMTVAGDLILNTTCINELPQGLTICGNLICSQTSISKLPHDISIGGSITVNDQQFGDLPPSIGEGATVIINGKTMTADEYRSNITGQSPFSSFI